MTRRGILALLTGALFFHPATTIAQPSEPARLVGVLVGLAESDPDAGRRVSAFQSGLQELGWIEGRNIRILYRWAPDPQQMTRYAKELIALRPDIIVASSTPVVEAILRESRTTPVVFVTAADPVGDGFVASLAQPGGNATGFTNNLSSMGGKWLELLREIAPNVMRVAIIYNRETAPGGGLYFLGPIRAAATTLGVTPLATSVREPAQIESALLTFGREPGGGLIVMPDNFTTVNRGQIIAQAAQNRLPAVYPFRYFAVDGGLVSYGADLIDLYRRASSYVDRILKGAKPADLPVQPPVKVELVINLKAANALGLTVPRIMLARADEVIE